MTEQVYKSWAIIPRGLEPFHKGKFALLQQSDILPLAQATIFWKLWSYLGIVATMCWKLRPHWRKQAKPSKPHKPMGSSSGNGEDTLGEVELPPFICCRVGDESCYELYLYKASLKVSHRRICPHIHACCLGIYMLARFVKFFLKTIAEKIELCKCSGFLSSLLMGAFVLHL